MNRTGCDYETLVEGMLDGRKLSINKNMTTCSVSSLSAFSSNENRVSRVTGGMPPTQQRMSQTYLLPQQKPTGGNQQENVRGNRFKEPTSGTQVRN